jgi:hypothetical protein
MSLSTLNIDILVEILDKIKYDNKLKKEVDSLLNVLLVNKYFCKLTLPILWENPFDLYKIDVERKNYLVIETYIKGFNEEERKNFSLEFENKSDEIMKQYNDYTPLLFEYGTYLKEFNNRDLNDAIISWFKIFKRKNSESLPYNLRWNDFKNHIIHSIMRQCQRLDCLNWNISLYDEKLLEIMQHKIKDLKNLTLYCNKDYNTKPETKKRMFDYFENICQNLSSLKIDLLYDNQITQDFISFVKSKNDLNEFIFDYYKSCGQCGIKRKCNYCNRRYHDENEEGNDKFNVLVTTTLELRAISLTKVVLNQLDFSNISFDYIDKCINLEILVLRSNKGLNFEDIDLHTSFNNLKNLDLCFNTWSSEVTICIIKKAGNNLTSLTIGEKDDKQTVNDETLNALVESCPNINSLSIYMISKKIYRIIFPYLKNFRLITLQIFQNKLKGTIMNSKDLFNYIENEEYLSTLGIGKNDDYWNYYDDRRDNFENLLKKHNVKLTPYNKFIDW